jgi:hypothetical protein
LDEKPKGFSSWNVAIQAVMEARTNNELPEEIGAHIWEAFETMALVLMPHISP